MKSLPQSLEVEIGLSDPVPTDRDAEKDFEALTKSQPISHITAEQLRALGIQIKRQGVLETQRGVLYVNQAWLLGVGQELYRLLMVKTKPVDGKDVDSAEVCKLADQLTKLVGKQAEVSSVMLSYEPVKPNGNEAPPALTPSFPAGTVVVGGNAHAHFHQTPPPTAEKTVAKPPSEA